MFPCSSTCGEGRRDRVRTCGPGARYLSSCPGESDEIEVCQGPVCHGWSSWGPWGACSVTCGEGSRRRERACSPLTRGGTCEGEASEEERCGQPCSAWTSWSPWSQCSTSCGPGSRTRERSCQGGPGSVGRLGLLTSQCPGASQDSEECRDRDCQPPPTSPPASPGCAGIKVPSGFYSFSGRPVTNVGE